METMKSATMRLLVLMSVGFLVACAGLLIVVFLGQLCATVARVTDRMPPQATFAFRSADGRVFQYSITVRPGEGFVPLLQVRDNVDPAPVASMWLSPVSERTSGAAGQPDQAISSGDRVIFATPGLWHIHARVADQSGNVANYGSVICVFNDPTTSAARSITDLPSPPR